MALIIYVSLFLNQLVLKERLFCSRGASNYIKESEFSDIQKLFQNATRTIEGVGHWVHAENLKPFMKYVMIFKNV